MRIWRSAQQKDYKSGWMVFVTEKWFLGPLGPPEELGRDETTSPTLTSPLACTQSSRLWGICILPHARGTRRGLSEQMALWDIGQWAEGDFMLYHSQGTRQRAQNYGWCSEGGKLEDQMNILQFRVSKNPIFTEINSLRPAIPE